MLKLVVLLAVINTISVGAMIVFNRKTPNLLQPSFTAYVVIASPSPIPIPKPSLAPLPSKKLLFNDYHIFQTFNNCGPAALSMALSYYEVYETQETLGQALRPFQNPKGNNDDKSVILEELGEKAKDYNLLYYHRPNGNIEIIKRFITYDMPVVTRTWLKPREDIGHYRVVKGFDDSARQLIQDDSLQGKNLRYSYQEFNILWQKFNYEYLVLVPPDKQLIAEMILGEDVDQTVAWNKAAENSRQKLQTDPKNIYDRFNLSVALYHIGEYETAVKEFEKNEHLLPFRTLWYQIEPIQSYFELGKYQRIFQITDKIFNNHNRAFSELYLIRGEVYRKQGKIELAKKEFEKAIFYNRNLKAAKEALEL